MSTHIPGTTPATLAESYPRTKAAGLVINYRYELGAFVMAEEVERVIARLELEIAKVKVFGVVSFTDSGAMK